ncbi:hypothetical protein NEPAR08_2470 [Nematocida parisii]|nr:hypothetical protein NEPAR08_2470 [Nematocida parisii]KAI5138220.1 hypothetical protein NEAUS07_2336 [Nematocida ausubeli]
MHAHALPRTPRRRTRSCARSRPLRCAPALFSFSFAAPALCTRSARAAPCAGCCALLCPVRAAVLSAGCVRALSRALALLACALFPGRRAQQHAHYCYGALRGMPSGHCARAFPPSAPYSPAHFGRCRVRLRSWGDTLAGRGTRAHSRPAQLPRLPAAALPRSAKYTILYSALCPVFFIFSARFLAAPACAHAALRAPALCACSARNSLRRLFSLLRAPSALVHARAPARSPLPCAARAPAHPCTLFFFWRAFSRAFSRLRARLSRKHTHAPVPVRCAVPVALRLSRLYAPCLSLLFPRTPCARFSSLCFAARLSGPLRAGGRSGRVRLLSSACSARVPALCASSPARGRCAKYARYLHHRGK